MAGTLDLNEIGERLSTIIAKKDIKKKNIVIHITYVDNMELLNEILINIALFRVYKSSSHIVVIPKECRIYIELSNTLGDIFENNIIYRKYIKDREHYI